MHQFHNANNYKCVNTAALKKFGQTCAKTPTVVGLQMRKIREPQIIIIRNKYTKEIVDLEELVGHTVQQRNWKGIVIALVVIIVVCALIVATIILISPNGDEEGTKAKFTFEDFIDNKYAPRSFSYKWIQDADAFYFKNEDGAVLRYNCSTNSSAIIMDNSTFRELDTSSYTISPGEYFALLPYEIKKIYRYSTSAKYKILNIHTEESRNLKGPKGLEFQYVSWSPTVDGVVFVQNNDVYYRRNMYDEGAFQVTSTGKPDEIFNGVPDWVFEEEILYKDNAIWWSPDGHYFVYASFNDSQVGLFDLTYYGDLKNQYVENKKLLYPKAGTENPTFSLHIFNTHTNTTVHIEPPDSLRDIDHYFTTVTWRNSQQVLITWLNRAQNMSIFTICSADNGSCYENYRFTAPSGWIDVYVSPTFTPDGGHYFLILPQREGDVGSYRHIAIIDASVTIDISAGLYGKRTFITTGLFDIIRILRYDHSARQIYYLAYRTGDPTSRHLFRTSTETGNDFQKPVCVTCSISKDCDWIRADFPDVGDNYMLWCLGPGVPTYTLRSFVSDTVITFEDNKDIAEDLAKIALPRTKIIQVPLNDKQMMWAKLKLPPELKEHEEITFNLLTSVYGGPDSQKVTKAFSLGWEDYLASSHGIVIANVDPRGTAGRGDAWRHANYRHLGSTEVDDTIVAARYFNKLKYISDKSAIWGWSYGGFLTSLALARGTNVFDCGIAVAPVTDYRYYDSVYTERFMGMPTADDNLEGYEATNISKFAENFKKSKFMIVHGTGDDNVHFQNTVQLIRSLTDANVYFRSQIYTDQQHSIRGGNSRRHLWNTLEDFLLQCYGGSRTRLDELNKESSEKDALNDS
ncbi:dipeptidyl peptidase 4-like isoform X2 [Mercenaria mercenaria]|uniref:dipeptidyl peptidase 4-like isoform X2 n=1 Tax=Mercenaria mercenaria TaxID=6596 RepID=UPI00234F32E4|nr:dipeptidyl peptidase 4-like isoform X2 [Mercenaria mercenaria]